MFSQGDFFNWAKKIDTPSEIFEANCGTTIDINGNLYITGSFTGTVDFDPGPSTYNLTSGIGADYDAFITKLDSNGNFIWAKQLFCAVLGAGQDIHVDNSGNIYITGFFTSSADFDPGPGTFTMFATVGTGWDEDVFILKLDASGNFVWAKKFGGTTFEQGFGITTDASGNVFTTGYFTSTVDFNPGAGTFNLTATAYDIFVSKLDGSGNFVWAKKVGSVNDDYGYAISVDNSGNVYTTGRFRNTADFNPGAGVFNMTVFGNYDAFVLKLDNAGNFVWAKQFGGTSNEEGRSILTDPSGSVYFSGNFQATCDFDPGAGIYNMASYGSSDGFITKLDASGNLIWTNQIGGSGIDFCDELCFDADYNIYCAGGFQTAADLDPGTGTYTLISNGGSDAFILKLSNTDNFVWAKQMGGTGDDKGLSISISSGHSIYTAGTFSTITDFDPGAGTYDLTSSAGTNIFIQKLGQFPSCITTSSSIAVTSCNSYVSPSGNYTWTTSGTYMDTIMNAVGCDSIITVNLVVNNSTTSTISPSACDNYVSPSGNYTFTSSGTYNDTVPNAIGCDSIIIINLVITNSSSGIITTIECDSYTSPSGNYTWTTSGTYLDTIPNVSGCDSVLTVSLTIDTSCVWPGDADNSFTVDNYDLLPIGVFYGNTGPSRSSVSNAWMEFPAMDYGILQPSGSDIKHSDCNGDGVIDNGDTLAINLNYSSVHLLPPPLTYVRSTDPDLYCVTTDTAYITGTWVDVDIMVGTFSETVTNLYGIGFTLEYDNTVIEPGTESMVFTNSWLTDLGADGISFAKIDGLASEVKAAVTRISHTPKSGYGKLATFRFKVKSSLSSTIPVNFEVSAYKGNDELGNLLNFDSGLINEVDFGPSTVGKTETSQHQNIKVYPNPFNSQTTIEYSLNVQSQVKIEVVNSLGENVCVLQNGLQANGTYRLLLDEKKLNGNGVYIVRYNVNGVAIESRIVLIR